MDRGHVTSHRDVLGCGDDVKLGSWSGPYEKGHVISHRDVLGCGDHARNSKGLVGMAK